jgi:hypothetical protein
MIRAGFAIAPTGSIGIRVIESGAIAAKYPHTSGVALPPLRPGKGACALRAGRRPSMAEGRGQPRIHHLIRFVNSITAAFFALVDHEHTQTRMEKTPCLPA